MDPHSKAQYEAKVKAMEALVVQARTTSDELLKNGVAINPGTVKLTMELNRLNAEMKKTLDELKRLREEG